MHITNIKHASLLYLSVHQIWQNITITILQQNITITTDIFTKKPKKN